jgi:hypothetical protein
MHHDRLKSETSWQLRDPHDNVNTSIQYNTIQYNTIQYGVNHVLDSENNIWTYVTNS